MSDSPSNASPPRVLATGFLMGLANLVPGVSGGTMVLAMGLYDRFIEAVAELTTLKISARLIVFLMVLGVGLVVALVGLAGPAVFLVSSYRWVMYSLFIGMTLGGVPELARSSRPATVPVFVATAAGLLVMVGLFLGLREASVPHNLIAFGLVGALAASSMILPGVSGSYILLIFGMYDVVIGSLSASAMKEDFGASVSVVLPVAVGAVLGIALLSNVLKLALSRWSGPSHGFLLGLLVGAVLGLWPFQDAVHKDLATKDARKSVEALLAGETVAAVNAEFDLELTDAKAAELKATYADATRGDLKQLGMKLERFRPSPLQVLGALILGVAGSLVTLLLGAHEERAKT